MKRVILITRHGFRHPKKVPNDGTTLDYDFDYLKYENIRKFVPIENAKDRAFLTQKGYNLALSNSKIIQKKYSDFLTTVQDKDIKLKTSDFQRTFYTLQAFYYGLFGKMVPDDIEIEQQDRAVDKMYANASRPLNKYFLKRIFETVITKDEINKFNEMLKTIDWTIDDVDDYLQQRQDHLTDTQKELFKMSHPRWEDYWNTYYFTFKSQEEKLKIVRPLYGHVAEYFLDRIINNSQYKFEIYSGHDSTLSTLLTCFQFNTKYHRHPFYADFMCIEVYDNYIRVYALIDGIQEYLQFDNGDIICSFSELKQHMKQYSISKQDADQLAEKLCSNLEQFY